MYVLQIHDINVHCTLLSCIPLTWLKSVLNDNSFCKHVPWQCVKIMAFFVSYISGKQIHEFGWSPQQWSINKKGS